MRLPRSVQLLALLGVIGATGYFGLLPYARHGLAAAHMEEIDPFRVRHGAELSIPADAIHYGAPKDRIPALSRPKFVPADQAPEWLADGDRVIGVVHNGVAKAYPILMLLWHEAVNDEVGGKPYLVTY